MGLGKLEHNEEAGCLVDEKNRMIADLGFVNINSVEWARRIVECVNKYDTLQASYEKLATAGKGLVEELENLEQDEGIAACQCVGKTPEMICDPLPCNYCQAKQALAEAEKIRKE